MHKLQLLCKIKFSCFFLFLPKKLMILSDISGLRLYNQKIIQPSFKKSEEVLSWLGAIQGQDYAGAKWSIGLRLVNAKETDVEDAFNRKQILRTWLMRGTLHMVSSKDLEWMRKLFAPKIIKGNARRYKELELDEPTLFKTNDIIIKALQEKTRLNRKELLAKIEESGISTQGQRAAYMLQRASYDGLICQTNTIRNVANFILIDKSFTDGMTLDRSEAIAELTKRYFKSRGPATIQDFVWWSGLTVAETKAGLEANKSLFCHEMIDGHSYWSPVENLPLKIARNLIHFLPGFDEFLLGYKDRSASLDPKFSNNWCPGNNGMFFPFIVMNGEVVGTWKRGFKKNVVVIEINSFNPQKKLDENPAILDAANKFCKFIDLTLRISNS